MSDDPTWPFRIGGENIEGNTIPLAFTPFSDVEATTSSNDFVEGLLTAGAMSVIYGPSNSGKTFFALHLALAVARGATWFGRDVVAGPVLYLALEGGAGIKNRLVAYRRSHELDGADIPFALVAQGLNLLDPASDLAAIIATAEAIAARFGAPVSMIVIDTLSRAMAGADENSSASMTALVDAGDRLRQATGAHVMWIHHSGKSESAGARGHSSLRAATDTEIEVTCEGPQRRATVRKQRDLTGGDVFDFTLETVELGTNDRGKPVTSCVVVPAGEGEHRPRNPAQALTGHARRAYEVLENVLAGEGQRGCDGAPAGCPSVPDA